MRLYHCFVLFFFFFFNDIKSEGTCSMSSDYWLERLLSLFSFCVCDSLSCCPFYLQVFRNSSHAQLPQVTAGCVPLISCMFLPVLCVPGGDRCASRHSLESILDYMRLLHFTIPACVCSVEFCLGNMLNVHICTSRLRILNFQVENQRHQNYS